MDRPLEIAFHNMRSSARIEADIRAYAAKLEQRYQHLTGMRVSVEALHRQHQTGNLYEVHVTLDVPGRQLATSRAPHRAAERFANPDLKVSLRQAFKAAERQLESFKTRIRDDTTAPSGSALSGEVMQIEPGADHGFVLNSTGSQIYFHRDSVTSGRFEDMRAGDAVHYVEEDGDIGPVATKVWPARPTSEREGVP